jgi:hypothetical protein
VWRLLPRPVFYTYKGVVVDETKLVKYLLDRLDICEGALKDLCQSRCNLYDRLVTTKREDLPALINQPEPTATWVKERLNDPTDTKWDCPQCWIDFLTNVEMTYEQYRVLGINDGELQSIAGIFNLLGMEEEAQRAFVSMYAE